MSNSPIIISLDLGTTVCKACAYDIDGSPLSRADRVIKTFRPSLGWNEQDPLDWYFTTIEVLTQVGQKLGSKVKNVQAISLSAHGPSLVLVDAELNPLARAPIWQDQRSFQHGLKLMQEAGTDWIGLGMPQTGFPAKLAWAIENQNSETKRARYFLGTKSFLIGKLTGQIFDEPSSCGRGGKWPKVVFDYLGINLERLSPILPSDAIGGQLKPDVAATIGLPINTQVVMGLNDGAAACLGAGLLSEGQGIISLSTNGVVRCVVSHELSTSSLLKNSLFSYSYIDNKYISGGFTKCGGDSVRWFSEVIKGDLVSTEEIEKTFNAPNSSPGASGVLFLPYLVGEGTPNSNDTSRAAFLGLARHHNQNDLARAVLEGVVYTLRDISEVFKQYGWEWTDIRLTGGGANNQLWREILTGIFNRPMTVMPTDSLLGVAMLGMVALNLYKNYEEAVSVMVHPGEEIQPSQNMSQFYQIQYQRFKRYQTALRVLDLPELTNA
jgi:xylulokinase